MSCRSKAVFVAFYVSLSVLTGAESFTGRKETVHYAAKKHEAAWQCFLDRGMDVDGNPEADINVASYCRRPLLLGLIDLTSKVTGISWSHGFSALRLLTILAAYLVFHMYLNIWFRHEVALLGTLFLGASLPLTFVSNWWEIISDFPELLTFTLGLWCLHAKNPLGLALVAALGTLNRETTVLLVIIAGAAAVLAGGRRFELQAVAAAFAGWAGAAFALRLWLAGGTAADSMASRLYLLEHNVDGILALVSNPHPYNAYLLPVHLFGVLWLLPLCALHRLPVALQAGLASVPLLLLLVLFVGGLNEPRQLMPLYPILVPASLIALFRPETNRPQEPNGPSGAA